MMRRAIVPLVVVVSALGAFTRGQARGQSDAKPLAFDVVSVKPNKSDDTRARIGRQPGGRWVMVNVSAAGLILTAYPTKLDELVGAPAWLSSDRFDVDARATFEPTNEQEQMMLRALLADRFKLAAHYEARERPVYNLVVARADRRLGPQIHRIDVDCATYKPQTSARGAPDLPGADPAPCTYSVHGGATLTMVSGGRTIEALANSIAGEVGRPVVDKTELKGYYAFTLDSVGDNGGTSIFTALQEQLGLKLESTRGLVDVVVIDHVEHPTED